MKPATPLRIRDMFTGPSGRLSHTRFWSNVGNGCACAIVVKMAWAGTLGAEVFGLYLVTVCANSQVSKWLTAKASAPQAGAFPSLYGSHPQSGAPGQHPAQE